ncbi:cytidine deaminase-like protein [Ceratobasidium sp. AG-I]|nr:cytidine deaminase-like protein [Ceratobasidium sp. AG-I]
MFQYVSKELQDPNHLKWMREALCMAEEAMEAREVPVGCVFVRDGKIIARARNRTNELRNATRHAELEAIDEIFASPSLTPTPTPLHPLSETDLYVTVEPCIMCASALRQLGLRATYFGAANERFGGCGSVLDVNERPAHPSYPASFGYLREDCIMVLRRFYMTENSNAPAPKTKARRVLKTFIAEPNELKTAPEYVPEARANQSS